MKETDVAKYVREVAKLAGREQVRENSFRPALTQLFNSIDPEIEAINEPAASDVGRPDFVFLRGKDKIRHGHAEAKDLDKDISKKGLRGYSKEQFKRYTKGLPNLIYTNGVDFRFYVDGEEKGKPVTIAHFGTKNGFQFTPLPDQYPFLIARLKDFAKEKVQTITSAERLAKRMAGKALIVKDVLFNTLDKNLDVNGNLVGQFKMFRKQLIHDLSPDEFADIYAQTIAYGMFAARLHDPTPKDFSREEALDLIPPSNPLLRGLFEYIAGTSLSAPIRDTIDELADIFQATRVDKLFRFFGEKDEDGRPLKKGHDPFIHFYETFLAEYDAKKRKARGVWYTPPAVVNFLVRAVDDVLRDEFRLADGLADTSKVEGTDVHRVQILDPAAGTGTFLAEVINLIAPRIRAYGSGEWNDYVEKDLIPRLHGFELLMASYAMCHLKLDMQLSELGYRPKGNYPPRLNVFLTNTLEAPDRTQYEMGFADWLATEANEANKVKGEKPIMCIIGNPPYLGESQNKSDFIMDLMEAYKKEPGGKVKLKERNPKWLNDDYVKFIRFSEHKIAENGEGVLAFITNHGYLDNPTFRGMRWHLMQTFDKIWVVDLHGNAKKKEVTPDGGKDENVFDIQQGVSLFVGMRKKREEGEEKPLAEVLHGDMWGRRSEKTKTLSVARLGQLVGEISPDPYYQMFYQVDPNLMAAYATGFSPDELCSVYSLGTLTKRDSLVIGFSIDEARSKISKFFDKDISDIVAASSFGLKLSDKDKWNVNEVRESGPQSALARMREIEYRPFDRRVIAYDDDLVARPNHRVLSHMTQPNFALVISRQPGAASLTEACSYFLSDTISDQNIFRRGGGTVFPLYLYPDDNSLDQTRRVNMDPKIRKAIADAAEHASRGRPDEVAIFDYIYGVLHCPAYRETYAEFLKIDFPRVPYPPNPEVFWDVADKGGELRRLHLMEPDAVGDAPYPFEGQGDNVVEITGRASWQSDGGGTGAVLINEHQHFDDVPEIAWNFWIGGYQPAQKWLKDRKGRELSREDRMHYRQIVKVLVETDRIMKTIEMPLGEVA